MSRGNLFLILVVSVFALSLVVPHAQAQSRTDKRTLPDKEFTIVKEMWRTPSKSQGRTGTCWSFGTTSFLESEAERLGRGKFELSEIHTVYFAYLEKDAVPTEIMARLK